MNSAVIIVHHNKPSPNDIRLKNLAEFLGLTCMTLDASNLHAELDRATDSSLCILMSARTAFEWWRNEPLNHEAAIERLRRKTRSLFVYGCAPSPDTSSILATLTDGVISDVQRFDQASFSYDVTSSHPKLTREFSGLSFGPIRNQADFGFVCSSASANLSSLVSICGLPFWALSVTGGCSTFLLASYEVVDIKEKINNSLDVVTYFSRLLPAAMFLKWALPNRCWHNRHRFANFIIDDPLLKESYGYLNYEDLLRRMDRNDFATTIAFIPWNYRRTQSEIAQLFRDRPDRLALCIHGCDHSDAEFATQDLADLNRRVHLASSRMNSHRASTGLAHSLVMVFPQGKFSPESLKVLKSNNYLAAVNSDATPSSLTMGQDLTISDFLEPAIVRYGGFPLYLRRYPGSLERFAFDLFFEKPLLLVEHQNYFKDTCRNLIDFVARLNSFGLEWQDLNKILQTSYLEREISYQTTECRIYTNLQVIENRSNSDRSFIVTKRHADDVPIDDILVNGQPVNFNVVDNTIEFTITVPKHASANVDILYRDILPCDKRRRSFSAAGRVWTRRMLSEFRDNYLCKSDFMLATARAVHQRLLRDRTQRRDLSAQNNGG